jgi:hypothetical protein
MADSFLQKCAGLPLQPGDKRSVAFIERNIRLGLYRYDEDAAVLTVELGMRVAIQPDGRFTPVA